jgi:hypothetical protein
VAVAGSSIWRFGLSRGERAAIARQVHPPAAGQAPVQPGGI